MVREQSELCPRVGSCWADPGSLLCHVPFFEQDQILEDDKTFAKTFRFQKKTCKMKIKKCPDLKNVMIKKMHRFKKNQI
jgi:hypothetical protein